MTNIQGLLEVSFISESWWPFISSHSAAFEIMNIIYKKNPLTKYFYSKIQTVAVALQF